jgi:DNA polymerase-1
MISSEILNKALERLAEAGYTKISFKDSKLFFDETGLNFKFYYDDLEVMKYLLKKEVSSGISGLKMIEAEKISVSYKQIERKMPFVLSEMEKIGILISKPKLQELEGELQAKIDILLKEIFAEAGEEFNVNSPKQVNEILFTKLALKTKKKTSGGELSTNAEVLEDLAFEGVKIAELMLEVRHLHKLKNTYTSVLLEKSGQSVDGRIRTTFSSTGTLTGRLTSKNPNLQNLPAKTEIGSKIKSCFEGKEGFSLISFDYSQIELRILAHIAEIPALKEAFLNNEDIHLATASKIFEIPKAEVSKQMRNNAKAINFGIIYGLSAFALAKSIKVSVSQANEYMASYFEKYDGIKQYMESTTNLAKEDGFVRTILGKKCYLENINSSNFQMRNHAIRAAINARIQGSAADLIKKAMVDIFEKENLIDENCRLVLQIHDELLFEIKNEKIEEKGGVIKNIMQNAIPISVPILVNQKLWNEAD